MGKPVMILVHGMQDAKEDYQTRVYYTLMRRAGLGGHIMSSEGVRGGGMDVEFMDIQMHRSWCTITLIEFTRTTSISTARSFTTSNLTFACSNSLILQRFSMRTSGLSCKQLSKSVGGRYFSLPFSSAFNTILPILDLYSPQSFKSSRRVR